MLTERDGAAASAPQVHAKRPGNTLIRGNVVSGQPESALEHAAHAVSGTFRTSYVEHAYIETEAGVGLAGGGHTCGSGLHTGTLHGPR